MIERLDFDLSLRWFVGSGTTDIVWDASTFPEYIEQMLDDVSSFVNACKLDRALDDGSHRARFLI